MDIPTIKETELLKPRNFIEVIEDSFSFLKYHFETLKKTFIRLLTPIIIVIAILEALSIINMPGLGHDGSTGLRLTSVSVIVGIATAIATIILFVRLYSMTCSVFYIHDNNKDQAAGPDELATVTKKYYWHVVMGFITWIPIHLIAALILGLIFGLVIWMNLTGLAIFLLIVVAFGLYPVYAFALFSAFPASIYEGTSYFHAFWENLEWGFTRFKRTWLTAFLVLLIYIVMLTIPTTLAFISQFLGTFLGGAGVWGGLPVLQSIATLIVSLITTSVTTIASIIVITIYGIYFFSLKEEFEGVMFREKLDETSGTPESN